MGTRNRGSPDCEDLMRWPKWLGGKGLKGDPPAPDGLKAFEAVLTPTSDANWIPALKFSADALDTLLTLSTWVYVCVTRVSTDISQLPGVIQFRKPGTNDWVNAGDFGALNPDQSAALEDLSAILVRPFGKGKDVPPWGWAQLLETLSIHQDLCGNAFMREAKAAGRLIALHLLNPYGVTVTEDSRGVAKAYDFSKGGVPYPADEIVNVMAASPGSFWQGVAPLTAAEKAVTIDHTAQARIKWDMTQRIAPGMVLKIKNHFGMTATQRAEIETLLTASYGAVEQAGRPLVVGDQTDIFVPPENRSAADLPGHRIQARDEILSIFKVPPPIAGVMDNATLQNANVALRLYWLQALRPKIGQILDAINGQAVWPLYGPDVRIWFELSDNELGLAVLRERADVAKILVRDLDYSTNDANRRTGLNMPIRSPELDVMGTASVIAGRTSGDGSGDAPADE